MKIKEAICLKKEVNSGVTTGQTIKIADTDFWSSFETSVYEFTVKGLGILSHKKGNH